MAADFSQNSGNSSVDEALAEYFRRLDRGEMVDQEAFAAEYPAVSNQLREYFSQERELAINDPHTETVAHHPDRTPRGTLQIRCPHCRTPTAVAVDSALVDLTCPSCGRVYSLIGSSSQTRSASPMSQIGHFELIERLGVGAFGSVWKARDTHLDRSVALKLPRQGQMDAEEIDKFLREARAAAQLKHPNIVAVHEVGRDGDSIYIVSDLVRGITLDDWLTGKQPTSREAAELCLTIALALNHAHEQGVVHRDLKPSNIMIDGGGEPHLMDFGLARREVGEVTMTIDGQVLGTPAYMSPEQAQGESHTADRRSDVYSLGVVLFKLLTGELPFRGNARMIMHQVIHDEPPSPRKLNGMVPLDLETITLKCLEKDPRMRYGSAAELGDELGRWLVGEPINARPISRLQRVYRWSFRHKPIAVAALLLVTLTLTATGWATREISLSQAYRSQLGETIVKTAELHGRKGEWQEALSLLSRVEKLGTDDPIALELARIRALDALNRKRLAQAELDALSQRADLGPHEAEVRMLQGMSLLASEGLEAAQPFFLKAKSLGSLRRSDELLINCMQAETSREALQALRSAVEADPYHQESRRFLSFLLASFGRHEEARLQAEAGRVLFPDDPNFALILARLAAEQGELELMDKHLQAPCLRQLDQQLVQKYGRALRMLHEYQSHTIAFWDIARGSGIRPEILDSKEVQEMLFSDSTNSPLDGIEADELRDQVLMVANLTASHFGQQVKSLSFRNINDHGPKCLSIAFEPMARLFSLRTVTFMTQGKGNVDAIDQLIDRLQTSIEAHPDGFLQYARGQLLFVRRRLHEAAQAFESSSQLYSAMGQYQTLSLFAAARSWYELYKAGNSNALDRAVELMQKRLDRGNLSRDHAEALYEIALEGHDHESVRRLIEALSSLGLSDDERWLRSARNKFNAGEFQAALRYVVRVPANSPKATEAKVLVEECMDSLRTLLQELSPKAPVGELTE